MKLVTNLSEHCHLVLIEVDGTMRWFVLFNNKINFVTILWGTIEHLNDIFHLLAIFITKGLSDYRFTAEVK